MRLNRKKSDEDRFIAVRHGKYHYKRRIPTSVGALDSRYPQIRLSLKTNDLAMARVMRDILEAADHDLWAALLTNSGVDVAQEGVNAARKSVAALRFSFKRRLQLAASNSPAEIWKPPPAPLEQPLTVPSFVEDARQPPTTVSQAFEIYCDEIMRSELAMKSKVQKRAWKKVKRHAVNNFIKVVADKPMDKITRDDGRKFYVWWLNRIAPKEGRRTHGGSIGNRDVGNMRVLYRHYFAHLGDSDRKNPFDHLSYREWKKRKRPPFPVEWIKTKMLAKGSLETMNEELRGAVLAMIETGARPSEICNLTPKMIDLEAKVPHLKIMPRDDPDDPREIKTETSIRSVPLIGVALAVFQKHRNGFPRYREKEGSMSAAANLYFKHNGLFPTNDHKLYSLRHSFEDRMKESGIDEELRRILMGHAIERPRYGSGGSLEWRRDELKKIELPFDPSIV
jgi:integrase